MLRPSTFPPENGVNIQCAPRVVRNPNGLCRIATDHPANFHGTTPMTAIYPAPSADHKPRPFTDDGSDAAPTPPPPGSNAPALPEGFLAALQDDVEMSVATAMAAAEGTPLPSAELPAGYEWDNA